MKTYVLVILLAAAPIEDVNKCALAGFMRLRICSIDESDEVKYSPYFYVRAENLILIGNPPDSRNECVAVQIANFGRLYVYGAIDEIVKARFAALVEYSKCLKY